MKESRVEEKKSPVLVSGAGDDFEQEAAPAVIDEPTDEGHMTRPFDPRKINVNAVSISLHSLLTRIKGNRIDMDPDFQRNSGIWTQRAKTRLIESLMIRLPLPAFYFDATDDDRWVVIDGLQRLTAIKEYVIDQKWALKTRDLEFVGKQCGDKYFDDLSLDFQGNIEESQIIACKVMQGTPAKVKFDIFRRINTGGLPLNPQEMRHAMNIGPITAFLKELADSPSFLKATGNMNAKRMNDRECVLRFLAFYENDPATYTSHDFDGYLNEYMIAFNRKCESLDVQGRDAYQDGLRAAFEKAMKLAVDLFGDDAFRKRYEIDAKVKYQVNKALFEAWSVNLARVDDISKDFLVKAKGRLLELFVKKMHDEDFDASVSQSTANVASVRCRFNGIRQLIEEVVYAKTDGAS